ncbi:hypothetical protein [Prosthecobacter sp.]|uniref:hypothetical protein n=1 Tax=Prosthecobacter sp. TaxID=1965333 RepID=UPI0037841088
MKPLLVIFFVFLITPFSFSQASHEDWLTYYYKSPSPDAFVKQVKAMAEKGLLKKEEAQPPIIGFLSRVMAANPKRIAGWIEELGSKEDEVRTVLLAAAWYSDTDEAREVFKNQKLDVYLKKRAPNILEIAPDNAGVLDMLWGYFMATGEAAPIRRIVSALSLSKYTGALERYKADPSPANQREAHLEVTFEAAMWSLENNCKGHPLVLQHCEEIFADKTLPPDQHHWLGVVLSKVKPEKYGQPPR